MQSLVQGAQGQWTDVQVCQLPTHLSEADGQGTPTSDLSIHVLPDALIRVQQATEVDLDTATANTPDTRQVDSQWAPPSQQIPFPKPIATKPVTCSRPAATAFALSTQSSRHSLPPPVVGAAKNVVHDGHEQFRKSQLYGPLEGCFCLQQCCLKLETGVDRNTTFRYLDHGAASS